jgi:hypothetical protein
MRTARRAIVPSMRTVLGAVRKRGAALFIASGLVLQPVWAFAQEASRNALEQLVHEATAEVEARYSRPLGRVAERRRERVIVILKQMPPPPGTVLEVVRGPAGQPGERIVARLEVLQTDSGLTECQEQERAGRTHAEPGDTVRLPVGAIRLVLAPCVSLAPLAPEIPQILGERLREALLHSGLFVLLDDAPTERRAEAAYLASAAAEFVSRLTNVDEVLFPVLVQTPGKLVLNLEYYSVERARATDIDVVAVPLDEMLRAWLQAGPAARGVPPGFRRLPPQMHPWRVTALGAGPVGQLIVVDADTVRLLRFDAPGLYELWSAPLGVRQRTRRAPWCVVIPATELQAAGLATEAGARAYLFSDEHRPVVLTWPLDPSAAERPELRQSTPDLDAALERLWTTMRPQGRRQESRWWPAPTHLAAVFYPSFADLDQDGRSDLVWTDDVGVLHVKLATQRGMSSFPGFGDVKAVQPPRLADARPVLWLTEPVWHGEPDRLYEAQPVGDELQVQWTSEPFAGTIVGLASVDLNGDGAADLVAAETAPEGTRLHVFLAFAGERAARASAQTAEGKP